MITTNLETVLVTEDAPKYYFFFVVAEIVCQSDFCCLFGSL